MTDHQHEDGESGEAAETADTPDCRALPGVEPSVVAAFVAALAAARKTLDGIPQRLEAARVHDEAFGKLIDAHKVRDAYHQRLPATERNIGEACAVIDHLTLEFAPAAAESESAASESTAVPAPRDAVVS